MIYVRFVCVNLVANVISPSMFLWNCFVLLCQIFAYHCYLYCSVLITRPPYITFGIPTHVSTESLVFIELSSYRYTFNLLCPLLLPIIIFLCPSLSPFLVITLSIFHAPILWFPHSTTPFISLFVITYGPCLYAFLCILVCAYRMFSFFTHQSNALSILLDEDLWKWKHEWR